MADAEPAPVPSPGAEMQMGKAWRGMAEGCSTGEVLLDLQRGMTTLLREAEARMARDQTSKSARLLCRPPWSPAVAAGTARRVWRDTEQAGGAFTGDFIRRATGAVYKYWKAWSLWRRRASPSTSSSACLPVRVEIGKNVEEAAWMLDHGSLVKRAGQKKTDFRFKNKTVGNFTSMVSWLPANAAAEVAAWMNGRGSLAKSAGDKKKDFRVKHKIVGTSTATPRPASQLPAKPAATAATAYCEFSKAALASERQLEASGMAFVMF